MSAVVVATAFGGPEVLSVVEQPSPEPGPGEVRIAVRAAGVNPVDYKRYSGTMGADPAQLPIRLGAEAAGVVTAVGAGVRAAVGDEVIAFRAAGAYAAEVVVPAEALTTKPPELPWDEAAGLLLAGCTAEHTMVATDVHPGDTVLIHGGAGGVGLMAVQLALGRGAQVVATASARHHERLRGLGAVPVTYGTGLADRVRAVAPSGIDVALDLVGTDEAMAVSLELVAERSRIATIVAYARASELGVLGLGGGPGGDPGTEIRAAARPKLAHLAETGALRILVASTYPLDHAAAAHREIQAGHTSGKIILRP
ncbi:MAG: putative oxidoreductase [Jatrophihabitans sp.]|nr:putative oxidoreductase [Jatrophihabitans sp.]